jgi:hypothetical protein
MNTITSMQNSQQKNYGENFSKDDFNALYKFLLEKSKSKKYELEFRFGSFRSGAFISSVDGSFFSLLKSSLSQHYIHSQTQIQTEEIIYEGGIRKIIGNEQKIIQKKRMNKYDSSDYGFRLCLSSEVELEKFDESAALPVLTRNKNRTSFLTKGNEHFSVRYDLTEVHQSDGKCLYEIEMEILTEGDIDEKIISQNVMQLYCAVYGILQTKQKNVFLIKETEKAVVLESYKRLTNSSYFIGAQAETLHISTVPKLYKEGYAVTDKADGERFFLLVNEVGEVYLINSNFRNIKKTQIFLELKNCLLDGEIIYYESQSISFYAFDILFYKGQDLRGKSEFTLTKRIALTNEVTLKVREKVVTPHYNFYTKNYIIYNVFLGSRLILEAESQFPYKLDGLIFTPLGAPYPKGKKWPDLLKWKPPHQTTVDFYSKRRGGNEWELYVRKPDSGQQKVVLTLFDSSLETTGRDELTCATTTFDDNVLDQITGQPFKTDTVIEYAFRDKKWVPLRTRYDKTDLYGNPMPNFYTVAIDVWKSITNPVTKSFLTNFNYTISYDTYFKYNNLRNFHNKMKGKMYNMYTKNCKSLLELCSGRGGDLHKWIGNNVSRVVGYDSNKSSIAECYKRIAQMSDGGAKKFDYQFSVCDLSRKETLDGIYKENEFTVVSCQFGLHYFWKSEEMIRNLLMFISGSLEKDGIFMGTIIDDSCVKEMFGEEKKKYLISSTNEIVYYLSIGSEWRDFGMELEMYLPGNNYLSSISKEYLINFTKLVSLAEEYGLFLEESSTKLFREDKLFGSGTLEEYEQHISQLYRTFSFRKAHTTNHSQKSLVQQKMPSLFNPENEREDHFISKPTKIKGLNFIFFTSAVGLLRIINTHTYTYNPLYHGNEEINEEWLKTLSKTNFLLIEGQNRIKIVNNLVNKNEVLVLFKKTFCKSTEHTGDVNESSELMESWAIVYDNDFSIFMQNLDNLSNLEGENTPVAEVPPDEKISSVEIDESISNLQKLKLKDLKELCKNNGLKVSGNKNELIERLSSLKLK